MIKNLLIITLLAFGSSAFANDLTTITVSGKDHYQGDKVLPLRALANQKLQAMGEDARDFELVGVTIEAKSKNGKGTATLIVGNDQNKQTVKEFGNNDLFFELTTPWSYNTMHWDLSGAEGQPGERWRLRFNGNIKVRSIQLHVASSTKRVRIPMGDQLFAQGSTIALKRELQQMGYDVRDARLRRVVLVAKSRAGQGQAKVLIGPNGGTAAQTVGQAQNGLGFQSNSPQSYNRLRYDFSGPTRGRWQIDLRGRIKVKAVIVEFK